MPQKTNPPTEAELRELLRQAADALEPLAAFVDRMPILIDPNSEYQPGWRVPARVALDADKVRLAIRKLLATPTEEEPTDAAVDK